MIAICYARKRAIGKKPEIRTEKMGSPYEEEEINRLAEFMREEADYLEKQEQEEEEESD